MVGPGGDSAELLAGKAVSGRRVLATASYAVGRFDRQTSDKFRAITSRLSLAVDDQEPVLPGGSFQLPCHWVDWLRLKWSDVIQSARLSGAVIVVYLPYESRETRTAYGLAENSVPMFGR